MKKPYNSGHTSKRVIIKYKENFKIGRGSTYNDNCYFNARFGIEIGENTLLGPGVVIQTSNHVIKNIDIEQNANGPGSWCEKNATMRIIGESVKIGNDVWVGTNVIILPGVIIPDKCVIGAGTLITNKWSKELEIGDIVVNETKLRKVGNRRNYD